MSTAQSSLETKSSDEEELNSSVPIELLSEFLSALMLRDYKVALDHCKTILNYEPENKTATEFYPLIQQRVNETLETANYSSADEDMLSSSLSSSYSNSSWESSSLGSSGEYSTDGTFLSCSGSGLKQNLTVTDFESDAQFESMDEKDDESH
ncbi:hypothetical protein CHUAL_009059 [Chamberlinius hualienensis]